MQNSIKISEVFAFALLRFAVAVGHVYSSIVARVHMKRLEPSVIVLRSEGSQPKMAENWSS